MGYILGDPTNVTSFGTREIFEGLELSFLSYCSYFDCDSLSSPGGVAIKIPENLVEIKGWETKVRGLWLRIFEGESDLFASS